MPEPTITSPIIKHLFSELRERLNTQYRQRIALGAKIDGPSWLRHVQNYIAPIVAVVDATAPDRSKETLLELYDIGLDLSALGHFNDAGGSLRVIQLWRDTFPAIADVLSLNPRIVIGSLSNAVLSLSQSSMPKTESWISMLTRLGPECRTVEQLLNLGKFLPWCSGFAHMRHSALRIAADLPADLLRLPLGLPDHASETTLRDLLSNLANNPWARPPGEVATPTITEVDRCGNFRGLDGEFLHLPKVYLREGRLHITDGRQQWQLHADRFGSTLHRVDAMESIPNAIQSSACISNDGCLTWDNLTIHRSDLAQCTSQSFDGQTLAITTQTSYHVFLFARQA